MRSNTMKQAIAGVAPPELSEVTVMTVWPSVGGEPLGRALGRLFCIRAGLGDILTVGNLLALASIPIGLALFAVKLAPWNCWRYRLTNRRVLVERGLHAVVVRAVGLDEFESIDLVVLPGQEWYPAGDLIFRRGPVETLRLTGVLRPETFRQTCLKAQRSYVAVERARAQ
jgi:hypothetical protein